MLLPEIVEQGGNCLPARTYELGDFFMCQVIGDAYFGTNPFGAIPDFGE